MPPPGAWDLDGELEGVEADRFEGKVRELLQNIGRFYRNGGFGESPIFFSLPEVYFFLDGKGKVQGRRFVITPATEEVGILLYLALADYHWESGDGAEVILVKMWNPGFQTFFQDPRYRPLVGAVMTLTPPVFLNFMGKKRERQSIGA